VVKAALGANTIQLKHGSAPTGYIWDKHNIKHLARHGVKPYEFEEVMRNNPLFQEEQIDEKRGEVRTVELGHTDASRVLIVIWTHRGGRIRPVTSYDPAREVCEEYLAQFDQE
jgi:uncharacterized DUF497 family protein